MTPHPTSIRPRRNRCRVPGMELKSVSHAPGGPGRPWATDRSDGGLVRLEVSGLPRPFDATIHQLEDGIQALL